MIQSTKTMKPALTTKSTLKMRPSSIMKSSAKVKPPPMLQSTLKMKLTLIMKAVKEAANSKHGVERGSGHAKFSCVIMASCLLAEINSNDRVNGSNEASSDDEVNFKDEAKSHYELQCTSEAGSNAKVNSKNETNSNNEVNPLRRFWLSAPSSSPSPLLQVRSKNESLERCSQL